MNWIFFAIISYFLFAVTAILDKFLLKKRIPSPAAYVFYVGILSMFSFILLPFDFAWTGWPDFIAELAIGGIFLGAVYTFILAIKNHEVSRSATLIGGLTPLFTLVLSFFLLGERLEASQLAAFILLISGGILITIKLNDEFKKHHNAQFWLAVGTAVVSAALFALYYVLAKQVFANQHFIPAFAYSRFGSFLAALIFLLVPTYRKEIFGTHKTAGVKGGVLFAINKVLAAISFISLNYSVKLGSATLVNAMQGIQFVFLLGLVILLSRKFPKILEEELDRKILLQKIIAVALIISGLVLLYV
jgi:drug/metabolite transporter (DMT)-like permease